MGGTPLWRRSKSRDAPETCGEDDGEEQLPAAMEDYACYRFTVPGTTWTSGGKALKQAMEEQSDLV